MKIMCFTMEVFSILPFGLIIIVIICIILIGLLNYYFRAKKNKSSVHPFHMNLKQVSINGEIIKYVEEGKGHPILMIHGSQMNSFDWRDNIGHFAKKYKVYAIDMVGCGWSDKPKGEYSPDYFAEFIKNFMDHFSIDNAILIASSWGGGHTLHFALKYPKRVTALILSSPCGYMHKLNTMDSLRIPLLGRLILLFVNKPMVRSQLNSAYYDTHKVTGTLVDAVYLPFLKTGFISCTINSYRNARFDFVEKNIGKINLPTLLLWGENDKIHPIEMASKMKNEIPSSKLIILKNCGHLPHSEKAELFNAHAEEFLNSLLGLAND